MLVPVLILILTLVLIVIGLVGCVVPGIPGPPIAYASLVVVSLASGWTSYGLPVLLILAALALFALFVDSILPVSAAKKAGAGKPGVWGSVIGMVLGMILLPPLGPILGAFLGALLGELIFNRQNRAPCKAALAILKGTMLATLCKLMITGVIAAYALSGALALL